MWNHPTIGYSIVCGVGRWNFTALTLIFNMAAIIVVKRGYFVGLTSSYIHYFYGFLSQMKDNASLHKITSSLLGINSFKIQFLDSIFQKNLEFWHEKYFILYIFIIIFLLNKIVIILFVMPLPFSVMLCGRCEVCIICMILWILGYSRSKFEFLSIFVFLFQLYYIMFCL